MNNTLENDQISSTARLVILGQVLLGQDPNWSHLVPEQTVTCGRHWIRETGGLLSYLVSCTDHAWLQKLAHLLQDTTIPGLFLHQTLRKRFIEERVQSLLNDGAGQLVVVGGGFDTLALRTSSHRSEVRCFELDRADTQRIKRSLPAHVQHRTEFIPADLEETTLDQVLRSKETYDPAVRTIFVVEGVSMYLDERPVRSLLDAVVSLAGEARHELILTFMDGRPGSCSFHNATLLADWWLRMKGEPFRWGCPRDEIDSFLARSDLVLQELQDHETLRNRYLEPSSEAVLARGELITHARADNTFS